MPAAGSTNPAVVQTVAPPARPSVLAGAAATARTARVGATVACGVAAPARCTRPPAPTAATRHRCHSSPAMTSPCSARTASSSAVDAAAAGLSDEGGTDRSQAPARRQDPNDAGSVASAARFAQLTPRQRLAPGVDPPAHELALPRERLACGCMAGALERAWRSLRPLRRAVRRPRTPTHSPRYTPASKADALSRSCASPATISARMRS